MRFVHSSKKGGGYVGRNVRMSRSKVIKQQCWGKDRYWRVSEELRIILIDRNSSCQKPRSKSIMLKATIQT